jgi:NADPH:quinone reductase-like Zn-dependent oxidoreductase
LPESGLVAPRPGNLSDAEAAALTDGGSVALGFFRRGRLQHGESVLVNGASGSVGTAAVQLATYFGAAVTGVCSTANVDLVRSLGATTVVDYTQTDFMQGGERYDVIVDTAGTAPFSRSRRSLAPGGRLLAVLGGLPDLLRAPWVAMTSGQQIVAGPTPARVEDIELLARLGAEGRFRPVIDRSYAFAQMVEAHRYVDTGHKKGNVVITLDQEE